MIEFQCDLGSWGLPFYGSYRKNMALDLGFLCLFITFWLRRAEGEKP